MTPKRRLEDAIGEGYLITDSGLLSPTRRLLERQAVERLLRHWNSTEGSTWVVISRPDDAVRDRPAPDFCCLEEQTGRIALIDVTTPALTRNFTAKSRQGAKEISFATKDVRSNLERLLKAKNKQLDKPADRHCVLIIWEGSSQDPLYTLWVGQISKIDMTPYPQINALYACTDNANDEVIEVRPR